MLIEICWSAEEEEGGYSLEESAAFLREAAKYIDIVQLRAWDADISHPTGFTLEEVPFVDYSEYMKKNVPGLIIESIGGYQDPETCEKVIAGDKADLISMARAWISNTDYGRLVKEGRRDDIVPCIRCNKCHGRIETEPMLSVCTVNPIIGLEHRIDRMVSEPRSPKKVAVIGGGPAGMKCAIDLCDRNHNVTIYEAESELGGAIRTADHADFKWPVKQFKEYCIRQIEKRDIEVKLNTKITPDELKKADYDIVVAAVGAVPLKPPIPGLDGDNVFYAPDVFLNRKGLGTNVVIIGGGEVGVECGMYLAKNGHEVTVLEMRDLLAADTTPIHYRSMFEAAWEAIPQFHSILNAKVAGVSKEGVTYLDREGKEEFISADSVVVSAGMQSKKEEALSFYGTADEFYMIGDCKKPATILEAMRTAFATAAQI